MHLRSLLMVGIATVVISFAPAVHAAVPEFGAQVWIEPGQTPEEIDSWFIEHTNCVTTCCVRRIAGIRLRF
jgi:hypothetical protein